jgi:dTDP-4-dehydrorhamnose reductase
MSGGTAITGASGLLGINWALQAYVREPVIMILHDRQIPLPGAQSWRLDLSSPDGVRALLEQERPGLLIHTVALTSVEVCEQNPSLAHKINVSLAENVAVACRYTGVKLVHISTDHLFDGSRPNAREDWMPVPLNVYGKTKGEAEDRVSEICQDALIIRTNFYGWGPDYRPSFSDMVVRALREGRSLTLFDDVHYTPTLMEPMIEAVNELVGSGAAGIYHLVGDDRVSKFEFGMALAEEFGLDRGQIRRGSIEDMPQLVRRPKDMSLSNAKLKAALGRGLGGLHMHLRRLREMENSDLNPSRLQ